MAIKLDDSDYTAPFSPFSSADLTRLMCLEFDIVPASPSGTTGVPTMRTINLILADRQQVIDLQRRTRTLIL